MLVAVTPTVSRADPHPQIFVGAQAGFSQFAYVGGSVPLVSGFGIRASGFTGQYNYDGGPSGQVHARFSGAQIEALYQYAKGATWLNIGVGVSDIDTDLSPFDPSNRRHGNQAEALVSLDGGHVSGPWRLDGYGSYGTRLEDFSVRGSLTHAIDGIWRAGLEGAVEGDPTYNEERLGPTAGVQINPSTDLLAAVGVDYQAGRGTGGFVRLAFEHSF